MPDKNFQTAPCGNGRTKRTKAHVNPLDHYDQCGWHEGRDPSPGFDTTDYLAAYADVAAANVDPLAHFLHYGFHEGRLPFADGSWG